MCKRGIVLVAVFATLTAWPANAGAQVKSPALRTQERILDSLAANFRVVHAKLVAYDDSVRRSNGFRDTLRVGALNLLVDRSLRARVERLAAIAAAQLDSIAGTGTKRLTNAWTVVRRQRASDDTLVVTSVGRVSGLEYWGAPADSTLVQWLRDQAIRQLRFSLDQPFKEWLRNELPFDSVKSDAWPRLRLQAVSSIFVVMRRCYDGNIAACSLGLGLPPATDPATQLLDSAGRQSFVEKTRGNYYWNVARSRQLRQCIDEHSDTSCIAAIRLINVNDIMPGARAMLTQVSIQMGGTKGFERLLNASGTPSDRIAAAAGVSADSVVRVWQRRMHDTRLPSQDMTPAIAMGSLAWVLAFGALSLRSSRWR